MKVKYNLFLFLIISVILFSCNNPYLNPAYIKKYDLLKDGFEIAKVDFRQGKIARLFIVTTLEKAKQNTFMQNVFCELKNSFNIDQYVNVSVFTNKKYAHYKTELFMGGDFEIEGLTILDWYLNYYLGEFSYETFEYEFKPMNRTQKQVSDLKSCHL